MSLSHLYEINLELFVEFFPHRDVLVLRVSEKLKVLSDSYQSVPFQQVKDELIISELIKRFRETLEVALLLHEHLQVSNVFNHLVEWFILTKNPSASL